MGRLRAWIIATACVFFVSAQGAFAQGYRFTVRDHHAASADSLLYLYDAGQLTVCEQAPDALPMLIDVITLTPTQRVGLDALAQAVWDSELVGRYTNPELDAGYDLTLAVTDPLGLTRQAYISNYHAPAVAELLSAVNAAVAPAQQSDYPQAELPLLVTHPVIVTGIDDPLFFAADIERINRGSSNIASVLTKLRRAVAQERDQPARAEEAQQILDAVTSWVSAQERAVEQTRDSDLPAAYALARDASAVLGRDAMSQPFDALVNEVRTDRPLLREIEAELALREAKVLAISIGLGGDVEEVRWDDRSRIVARDLGDRMDIIASAYRGTDAADEARETIALWREQVRAIEARQPRWLYTWHIDLIPLGTEERVRLRTDARGELVTEIDTEIVYDTRTVIMHGTFQNTSSEAHRYTFLAGVISNRADNDPFASGDTDQMLGYERVQTPVLAPGELYEWSAEVAVRNIRAIRRGGLGQVVADQPE